MEMQPLSQGQCPQVWPWGVAMYTNLQHYQSQYEREQMFEKPLTPSDVGKLNRLVIPKQHAERYFPLGGSGGSGGDAGGDKGLLLSFEDEAGKPWRFRYSYWTSSQSYVLTKGWSRYVKEKRLDAGDVVRFERVRALGAGDRLIIACRRRGEGAAPALAAVRAPPPATNAGGGEQQPWSPMCYSTSASSHPASPANSCAYRRSVDHDHADVLHSAGEADTKSSSAAVLAAPLPSRRLRLFGVNLDCGPEPEPEPTTMYGAYMHQQNPPAVSTVPNYWGSS